jgi:oligopeptidase B
MNKIKSSIPKAKKKAFQFEEFGQKRGDNYHWMRLTDAQKEASEKDEQTQEVLDYLNSENAYFQEETKSFEGLREELFEEIKSRVKEDDQSVPYFKNGYFYISKYEKGKQYPIYVRRKTLMSNPEELLFDVNVMAKGHEYYNLGGMSISPDNCFAIFGEDTVSRRQYKLKLKDLRTGEIRDLGISNTNGSAVWASDSKTVFFYRKRSQYFEK